ncbi:MAG: isoprenylcysteine carboxylmethyltransferase family protein [Nakamurella sp.]
MTAAASAASKVQGARVVPIPPPLYYAAAFAAGMALHRTGTPLSFGAAPVILVAGSAVAMGGAGLAVAGIGQVRRARTTIVPHRPVSALLTGGAYRISRNPMYSGLAIAYVGASIFTGTWWPLITWPLAMIAIRVLVIGPEERYLTTRFGRPYLGYLTRTRRWIGRTTEHSPRQSTEQAPATRTSPQADLEESACALHGA